MCNDPEVTKILGYIHSHPKTDRDPTTFVLGLKKVPELVVIKMDGQGTEVLLNFSFLKGFYTLSQNKYIVSSNYVEPYKPCNPLKYRYYLGGGGVK